MTTSVLSDPERVLSPKAIENVTGLSRGTIWLLRKNDDFPTAVRLSPNRIGYRAGDVANWLKARGAGSARAA